MKSRRRSFNLHSSESSIYGTQVWRRLCRCAAADFFFFQQWLNSRIAPSGHHSLACVDGKGQVWLANASLHISADFLAPHHHRLPVNQELMKGKLWHMCHLARSHLCLGPGCHSESTALSFHLALFVHGRSFFALLIFSSPLKQIMQTISNFSCSPQPAVQF